MRITRSSCILAYRRFVIVGRSTARSLIDKCIVGFGLLSSVKILIDCSSVIIVAILVQFGPVLSAFIILVNHSPVIVVALL